MASARRDTIEHWAGDFCTSSAFTDYPSVVREYAPQVLVAFLEAACAARGVEPADIEESDMKPGLLTGVAPLELPGSVREGIPELCAAFLGAMEAGGRLSGGRQLGMYVKALRTPFLEAASGTSKPIVNPSAKVGRNDPCPCGSGRKFKKCCQDVLP